MVERGCQECWFDITALRSPRFQLLNEWYWLVDRLLFSIQLNWYLHGCAIIRASHRKVKRQFLNIGGNTNFSNLAVFGDTSMFSYARCGLYPQTPIRKVTVEKDPARLVLLLVLQIPTCRSITHRLVQISDMNFFHHTLTLWSVIICAYDHVILGTFHQSNVHMIIWSYAHATRTLPGHKGEALL